MVLRAPLIPVALLYATLSMAQADTTAIRIVHAPACDTRVSLAQLQRLPVRTATVLAHDGEANTYAGALLWDVMALACPTIPAAAKRDRIGMAVRIDASDDYHAVIALMEADTSFRKEPVLLCWQKNGQPLDAHDGPLQLIVPEDRRHARNVRHATKLTVVSP